MRQIATPKKTALTNIARNTCRLGIRMWKTRKVIILDLNRLLWCRDNNSKSNIG
jgi:hypothetical protein